MRNIPVGTSPNKLALSTDGTQLFVGIDGAGAVAQVNLAQGKVVNQFGIGGGPGVYNPPYTAAALAAVPGLPNSVAVATVGDISGAGVTIFDSGVARTGSSVSVGEGPLGFGLLPRQRSISGPRMWIHLPLPLPASRSRRSSALIPHPHLAPSSTTTARSIYPPAR